MVVTCEECGARYKLDPGKIAGRGAKITCPRCQHVFVVYPPQAPGPAASDAPADTSSGDAPSAKRADLDAYNLDFRQVGIHSWKVKVKIGLVYDFSDLRTLTRYISEGRVTQTDLLSPDGVVWTAIGDIDDLEAHFIDTWLEAQGGAQGDAATGSDAPAEDEPHPNDFDDDIPTNIVGMGDLVEMATGEVEAAEKVIAAASSGGDRPDAAPRFVDPFESRRGGSKRPARAPTRAPEPAQERSKLPLVLGGVAVVAALAWFFWPSSPAPVPTPPPTAPQQHEAKAPPSDHVSTRERIRTEIEAGLQPVEAPVEQPIEPEERVLIPIGPDRRPQVPQSFVVEGGPSQGSSSAVDHAAVGEDALARGDWHDAVTAYRNAVAASPGDPRYRERLGLALYRSGDPDAAVPELTKAVAGGVVVAHKWLGDIARDQGDSAGALGHYNTYLKSNPSDTQVRREIESLQGG